MSNIRSKILSPATMRSRFITAVKNNPSLSLDKVENFLAEWDHDKPNFDLQARVDALVEKFRDDELGISGRPKNYLCRTDKSLRRTLIYCKRL